MNRIVLTLAVALLVCVPPSAGQEWSEVSRDILDMTAIPEDPEADAVVLFDKATVAITLRFQLVQQRHVRIKILTQRGLRYANISIPFWHKDKVKNLKAHTILPDGKRINLKKKDIFEKRKGKNLKEKMFAIPGAQPGAVVEYAYEISGRQLAFLAPWQFQGAEFTRRSELTVIIPEGFDYRAFCANFRGNVGVPQPTRELLQFADPTMGRCVVGKFSWRVENLPGIKAEPYMTSLKDYLATIYFQVASYQNPKDSFAKPVVLLKTWDDLAEAVRTDYKPFLQATRTLKALASDLVSGAADERAKARSVYGYVRETIETAASNGAAPQKRPNDMVKDIRFEGESGKFGVQSARRLFVNPNILNRKTPDDVPREKDRKFPVHHPFASSSMDSLSIFIPDGFDLEAAPRSQEIVAPFGHFRTAYAFSNGKLEYSRTFRCERTHIPLSMYQDYVSFLQNVVKADGSQFVFVEARQR